MTCPNCGAAVRKTMAFCENCGTRLQIASVRTGGAGAGASAGSAPRRKNRAVVIAIAAVTVCAAAVLVFALRPGEDKASGDEYSPRETSDASTRDDRKDSDGETRVLKLPLPPARDTESPPVETAPPDYETPEESASEEPPEEPEPPPVPERDYIIADSASRALSETELAEYSNVELVLARNEIYARHGRKFGSKLLRDYFGAKSWYTPVYEPESFPGGLLSAVENGNVALLLSYRDRRAAGELAYQGSGSADLDSYQVFYDSDSRYLTQAEVLMLADDDVELAIYEIYARNGMRFDSPKWSEYFKSFTWYKPDIPQSEVDDSMLNEFERANVALLAERRS